MIVRIRKAAVQAAAAARRSQSTLSSGPSRLTACPQSILEWRHELASPIASSQRLLDKLHQAIQAPLPPLQEGKAWIKPHDLQDSLNKIFADGRGSNTKEKDMLDLIIVGAQRCFEDARRRVRVDLQTKHGAEPETSLSELEEETMVDQHPDVIAWRNVLTSHRLLYHRLRLATDTLRKPHIEDLKDAVALLQGAPSMRRGHLQQLLRLIVRMMPTSLNQPAKVNRFLATKPTLRQLQLNISFDKEQNISHSRRPVYNSEYLSLPQDFKQIFETTWSQLSSRYDVDATCLHIALEMECKLALWRAVSSETAEDAFGPVRDLVHKIRERGMLRTRHLNTVLRSAMCNIPQGKAPPPMWPSMGDCLDLYQYMRANVLWIEIEFERRQEGKVESGRERPVASTSTMQDAFGVDRFLPIGILPDQGTYELLIHSLSWQGELVKATQVLLEMTQSPIDTGDRLKALKRRHERSAVAALEGEGQKKEGELESITYEATIATFDSFFRGFCQHGSASALVHFDTEHPERSKWTTQGSSNEWNIEALNSLLEAFLALRARECRRVQDGYRDRSSVKGQSRTRREETASVSKTDYEWLDEVVDGEGLFQSIISLELPVDRSQEHSCQAPSTQQLFRLLTALRRTSNDNPQWVLYQWHRIVDKFSLSQDDVGKVNHEGWHSWALDARLRRIIAHLEEQVDEQRKEQKKAIDGVLESHISTQSSA